ncbi:hypothetical protein amrb99_15110 [Actinomadura sp. RB99]|uniref:hypothetical protein n=1 Tax=Actinomadura sp. RB99 TaxID=2691577 RepID=UPI00168A1CF4|nr:hypothetical protein [Actinomadura sp. RB99]MBD2892601.1 hypothetical protein [Actinomadura sp. RB99]
MTEPNDRSDSQCDDKPTAEILAETLGLVYEATQQITGQHVQEKLEELLQAHGCECEPDPDGLEFPLDTAVLVDDVGEDPALSGFMGVSARWAAAQDLVAAGRNEADEIVADARAEAERIIADARSRAAEIEQSALARASEVIDSAHEHVKRTTRQSDAQVSGVGPLPRSALPILYEAADDSPGDVFPRELLLTYTLRRSWMINVLRPPVEGIRRSWSSSVLFAHPTCNPVIWGIQLKAAGEQLALFDLPETNTQVPYDGRSAAAEIVAACLERKSARLRNLDRLRAMLEKLESRKEQETQADQRRQDLVSW